MDGILPKLTAQNGSRVAQEQVDKKQREYHLIGRQRKVSGHTLFEFNRRTKEIRPANISRGSQSSIYRWVSAVHNTNRSSSRLLLYSSTQCKKRKKETC